jgi:hypothetical protein
MSAILATDFDDWLRLKLEEIKLQQIAFRRCGSPVRPT